MKVYPVEGKTVRDVRARPPLTVPAEGLTVPDGDPFWVRRVRAGDVTLTPPQSPAQAVPVAAPAVTHEATISTATEGAKA